MRATYWPSDISKTVSYRYGKRPIFEYVQEHAIRMPASIALIYYGYEMSWKELDGSSNRLADFLTRIGIKKGDRVALCLPNCPQFVIAYIGVSKIGAIIVPLNPFYKEHEMEYALNDIEAKTIITLDHNYSIINKIRSNTFLENVIITSFKDFLSHKATIPFNEPIEAEIGRIENKDYRFTEILTGHEPEENVSCDIDLDDTYLIIFTSGTTGLPKGAMLSYRNAIYKAAAGNQSIMHPINENDVHLLVFPLMHIGGINCLNMDLYSGIPTVLLLRFDLEAVITAIEKHKCTIFVNMTQTIRAILDYPGIRKRDLSSLRKTPATSIGGVITEELASQWKNLTGQETWEVTLGMTETHDCDTFQPLEKRKFGRDVCCGIPVPGCEIRIVNLSTQKDVPPGEEGEIIIKNEGVFKGYWKNSEKSSEVLKHGWLYSGDLGRFDEEGYLWYLGRSKELIKSSGFSVFPEEVESIISKHPAVSEVLVYGVYDEKKGQAIKAVIVSCSEWGDILTEKEIICWCRDNMVGYKIPKYVEFVDQFPRGVSDKPLRKVLEENDPLNEENKQ